MADLAVTVPQGFWLDWMAEGDVPGQPPGGAFDRYDFTCDSTRRAKPPIEPGERVYVVCHGHVRGYAPLVEIAAVNGRWSLVRAGGAVAMTIPEPVRGFQGWRKRWWDRAVELEFPDWKFCGVRLPCAYCRRARHAAHYSERFKLLVCADCLVKNIATLAEKGTPYPPDDILRLREGIASARRFDASIAAAAATATSRRRHANI